MCRKLLYRGSNGGRAARLCGSTPAISEQQHSGSGLPSKTLEVSSPNLPHAEEHDEWLLDEALKETFPASDAIAISFDRRDVRPLENLHGTSGSDEMTSGTSNCGVGYGTHAEALETAIECDHCHTGIPATVALNFEGADYIYHFCGPQCLDAWCKATVAHAE